jgi:hypothetical protein
LAKIILTPERLSASLGFLDGLGAILCLFFELPLYICRGWQCRVILNPVKPIIIPNITYTNR